MENPIKTIDAITSESNFIVDFIMQQAESYRQNLLHNVKCVTQNITKHAQLLDSNILDRVRLINYLIFQQAQIFSDKVVNEAKSVSSSISHEFKRIDISIYSDAQIKDSFEVAQDHLSFSDPIPSFSFHQNLPLNSHQNNHKQHTVRQDDSAERTNQENPLIQHQNNHIVIPTSSLTQITVNGLGPKISTPHDNNLPTLLLGWNRCVLPASQQRDNDNTEEDTNYVNADMLPYLDQVNQSESESPTFNYDPNNKSTSKYSGNTPDVKIVFTQIQKKNTKKTVFSDIALSKKGTLKQIKNKFKKPFSKDCKSTRKPCNKIRKNNEKCCTFGQCIVCNKNVLVKGMACHMARHVKESLYLCHHCGKGFVDHSDLIEHAIVHDANRLKYDCEICQQTCKTLKLLNRHRKTHLVDRKKYECGNCDKTFLARSSLRFHVYITHNDKIQTIECDLCDKTFSSLHYLKAHKKAVHLKDKRHLCDICNARFLSPFEMRAHRGIHFDVKKFQCEICGYGCMKRGILNYHMKKHTSTEADMLSCAFCGFKCLYKFELNKHERTHTGERPYVCKDCGKTFTRNSHLVKHAMIHNGNPNKCIKCGITLSSKRALQLHMGEHILTKFDQDI